MNSSNKHFNSTNSVFFSQTITFSNGNCRENLFIFIFFHPLISSNRPSQLVYHFILTIPSMYGLGSTISEFTLSVEKKGKTQKLKAKSFPKKKLTHPQSHWYFISFKLGNYHSFHSQYSISKETTKTCKTP